jgi:hypothetical protein
MVFYYFDLSTILLSVALSVGDRRAFAYTFTATSVSGLGFLFWLFILGLTMSSDKHYLRAHSFSLYAIAFYLITYFVVEFTARIFESSLPVVFLDLLDLKSSRKNLFLLVMIVYVSILWCLRFELPSAGF